MLGDAGQAKCHIFSIGIFEINGLKISYLIKINFLLFFKWLRLRKFPEDKLSIHKTFSPLSKSLSIR